AGKDYLVGLIRCFENKPRNPGCKKIRNTGSTSPLLLRSPSITSSAGLPAPVLEMAACRARVSLKASGNFTLQV
ncbi:MAG: hypothetical protein V1794_17950, partial [Candidatus Glassbacteria bacterium]